MGHIYLYENDNNYFLSPTSFIMTQDGGPHTDGKNFLGSGQHH